MSSKAAQQQPTGTKIRYAGDDGIAKGVWVLIVGPSGAGKDTLINLARTALIGHPKIQFARRIVTRARNNFEDHDSVSSEDFTAMRETGEFTFSWSAHGLNYGIHRKWQKSVAAGQVVVCNASRTIISEAKERFANIATVLVTAPDEILAARIRARGRDSAKGSRTKRNLNSLVAQHIELTINNTATPDAGAQQLINFLEALAIANHRA